MSANEFNFLEENRSKHQAQMGTMKALGSAAEKINGYAAKTGEMPYTALAAGGGLSELSFEELLQLQTQLQSEIARRAGLLGQ